MSSDGFSFNVVMMMYELCVPFMKLGDDKINKIDPTYIPSGLRLDFGDSETALCSIKELKQPIVFQKEYGTISEFYFMFIESLHFGLAHIYKK